MIDHKSDHLVPKNIEKTTTIMDLDHMKIKRRVNFNLTINIKQESSIDDACVPSASLSDYSDGESLAEQPIPMTPGGKPQVCYAYR